MIEVEKKIPDSRKQFDTTVFLLHVSVWIRRSAGCSTKFGPLSVCFPCAVSTGLLQSIVHAVDPGLGSSLNFSSGAPGLLGPTFGSRRAE